MQETRTKKRETERVTDQKSGLAVRPYFEPNKTLLRPTTPARLEAWPSEKRLLRPCFEQSSAAPVGHNTGQARSLAFREALARPSSASGTSGSSCPARG